MFTLFSMVLLRSLVTDDFITWDLSVPHFDPSEYLKWTFSVNNEIGAGGEFIFPPYPIFLETLLVFLTNNITAAKIMTIAPITLSFATFYYSTKKLSFGRISSTCGAFFYAVCPISFALLFSPVQQWFYVLLPLVVTFTLLHVHTIWRSDKFQIYPTLTLSVLYAIALAFMPQGILLVVPIIFVVVCYLIIKYPRDFKLKFKRLILSGIIVSTLSFVLLLPFSAAFLLPYFSFLSSGKFVDDPLQASREALYVDTRIYNSIRLAGIGDYHIGELGYNNMTSPINILGLAAGLSIVIVPIVILYKDNYRRKLKQITLEHPRQLDFLVIVLIILLAGILIIELGRNGSLWQLPLSSLLRNPIKPMMLISVSLGFLVSYLVFLIPSFVKNKANLFAYLIFITVVCTSTIYTSRYMDGTGWIGPYTKYWRAQGHPIEPTDYIITPSMKEIAGFAKSAEKTDLQPYRFFIFPLMPTQIQFFRYNLPLISGDSIGSFASEKLYSEYIDKVNDLILSGDNRSAVSLSPLRGKYIAIIDDVNSVRL